MVRVDGCDGRHLPGVPLHARMFLKVRFAQDSPVEESGFEPSVPLAKESARVAERKSRRADRLQQRTEGAVTAICTGSSRP